MSKLLNAFFEFKNEAEGTKRFALAAIAIITLSLAMLSICGAWALSEGRGDWLGQFLSFIPRLFYACLVFGLEMLAAVLFVRALVAAHWMQAAVCCVMLLFLAWANVQNAKDGVHFIFPTRFAESGQTLNDKADLALEQAGEIKTAAGVAVASIPDQLATARTDLAKLEAEQNLMKSPTRVREAQQHLQSLGLYRGKIDGLYQDLTEEAMLARGDIIRGDMEILRNKISSLESGAPVSTTATANNDKRVEEIETRAAAREATASAWRLEIILWVAEIARSLGLWAAVASIRLGANAGTLRRREELEEEEHLNALAELRAKRAKEVQPAPSETASESPAEPVAEPIAAEAPTLPPEPELTDAQRRGRAGGLGAGQAKAAARAKNERLILVPSLVARDAELAAAKLAAE